MRGNLILFILAIFLFIWAISEITERRDRNEFVKEVESFMYIGDRFTIHDGYEMCLRISHMERVHHDYKDVIDCKKKYYGNGEVDAVRN